MQNKNIKMQKLICMGRGEFDAYESIYVFFLMNKKLDPLFSQHNKTYNICFYFI